MSHPRLSTSVIIHNAKVWRPMDTTDGPRIPPLLEGEWTEEIRALIEQNWSGEPPGNMNNLYRTLARHPTVFATWSNFGRALLNGHLAPRDRELLVLRAAWLTQCRFEWAYHQPLSLRVGLLAAEVDRVTQGSCAAEWTDVDAALLRAVDELMTHARLSPDTWDVCRAHFNDAQIIEILAVVGQYQLVAYITNTLGIEPHGGLPELPRHEDRTD